MSEWKARGKESSPQDTIKRINEILDRYGIKTEMIEYESEVKECSSCSLFVMGKDGPVFSTNGKGRTRELAHASAYGEMMERLSNRTFGANYNESYYNLSDFSAKVNSWYDVYDEEQSEIVMDFKRRIAATMKMPMPEKLKLLYVNKALENFSLEELKGKYPVSEFYSLKDNKAVELPVFMLKMGGSNGMAAGNTLEEALVEGMSELIERYCQGRFMDGEITLPEIPRKYVEENAPDVMKTIRRIEANKLYDVRILDCSLGIKLPTVCGVIIERNTGHFCAKFGSHPFFEVAVERVFTEALQGKTLSKAVRNNVPDFMAGKRDKRDNRYNFFKCGAGAVSARLLMKDSDYEFSPWENLRGASNRELCIYLAEKLKSLGSDVLIKNVSIMGFPAVFIYVPGVSEVPMKADMVTLTRFELQRRVFGYFTHLSRLSEDEVRDIERLADMTKNFSGEKTISSLCGIEFHNHMHGYPHELLFLMAMCNYMLGSYDMAIKYLNKVLMDAGAMEWDEVAFVRCVTEYIKGIEAETDEYKLREIIEALYPDVCKEVFYYLVDKSGILGRLYPQCAQVREKSNDLPDVFMLMDILDRAEAENPVCDEAIKKIFSSN